MTEIRRVIAADRMGAAPAGLGGLANGWIKFLLSGKSSGATSRLRLFFTHRYF
jgi:hypothetical protein